MKDKKGFTLLELLVVVLIIGILAAIALPQYNRTVTKAKYAEVLVNVKAVEDAIDRYLLANDGFPSTHMGTNMLKTVDLELTGGEWIDTSTYKINKKNYTAFCSNGGCEFSVCEEGNCYQSAMLDVYWWSGGKSKQCYTNNNEKGRLICKYLESQGWEYVDDEY